MSEAKQTYAQMITRAISELNERGGSSRQAIKSFIVMTYEGVNFDDARTKAAFKNALNRGLESGHFIQLKQSFRLGVKKPATTTKKKTSATKKTSTTKKTSAKKTTTKAQTTKTTTKKTTTTKAQTTKTTAKKATTTKAPAKKSTKKKPATKKPATKKK